MMRPSISGFFRPLPPGCLQPAGILRPGRLLLAGASRSLRVFALALIVVTATGCDNMSWGGVNLSLQSSAAASGSGPEEDEEDDALTPPEAADGPVLFLVRRDASAEAGGGSLVPLAVISGDSLLPIMDDDGQPGFRATFTSEQLSARSTFTLFSEGTRVGTFRSDGQITTDTSFCLARPRVGGVVELVPEAAEASVFLAFREEGGADFRHEAFRPLQSTYDQRVASLDLVGELIPRLSAPWPPSVLDARRDLKIFALDGSAEGAIAATFMHRDALSVGPAPEDAYSLFFIAENGGAGYRPEYVWYRAAAEGKAAPRFVTHLDWNGDGSDGVVLEVQGTETRWFAAAGRRGGAWQTLFEDPCGQTASAGRAGALD